MAPKSVAGIKNNIHEITVARMGTESGRSATEGIMEKRTIIRHTDPPAKKKRFDRIFMEGCLSMTLPPRYDPRESPPSTTPITAVHVYREFPRMGAIAREAVSSRTITAHPTKKERPHARY
jgi:hypothetical protein